MRRISVVAAVLVASAAAAGCGRSATAVEVHEPVAAEIDGPDLNGGTTGPVTTGGGGGAVGSGGATGGPPPTGNR